MRRRAVQMIVAAVTIAVLLLGVPLAILGGTLVWRSERVSLELRNSSLVRTVERRIADNETIDQRVLEPWVGGESNLPAAITVRLPDGETVLAGPDDFDSVLRASTPTASGAEVIMEVNADSVTWAVVKVVFLITIASGFAIAVGVMVAYRQARKLSAPLIYLAASAEQIGQGQVRPRLSPSGIEEIDLVGAELVRTADRMAARLAAERQFAADASHQLRTPLTALSMRLEEIEMVTDQEEVRDEARRSLEQIERLTGVVDDLLKTSRSASGGTTEVVDLSEIFSQQREEWRASFAAAERDLDIQSEGCGQVLATPGSLSQALATVLENSLKYGDGTTSVSCRQASGAKGIYIDIADEGEGVSDDLADHIFTKHVSGHSGTGLGLALAKDLVTADGGRLELRQRRPPIFTIFLRAVPKTLNPEVVVPTGSLVTVGRRRGKR